MGRKAKVNLARRNAALIAASLAFALLVSEGLTRVYLSSRHVEAGAALVAEREEILGRFAPGGRSSAKAQLGRWEDSLELHPFFGYVFKPGISLPSANPTGPRKANRMGFQTDHEIALCGDRYCIDGEPDRRKLFVVGIFGGSFAHFAGEFGDHLEKALEPDFPGRKVIVLNLAMGGHAFPQASNIYSYFRDVIDVPVFLDGLNEVWNGPYNNRAGFPPEYAKAFHFKVLAEAGRLGPERRLILEKIDSLKAKIRYATELSLGWGVRGSALAYLAWNLATSRWTNTIQSETEKIERVGQKTQPFFSTPDSEIYAFTARQWGEYHRLTAATARLSGVPSIHLLQPNPFVEGSKVFTPEEDRLVNHTFNTKPSVVAGYPALRRAVVALKAEHLIAEDLCDLYKNVREDVWIDSAHANERGYDLVLARVAGLIRKNVARRSLAKR